MNRFLSENRFFLGTVRWGGRITMCGESLREDLRNEIMELVRGRDSDKSICPSEAARDYAGDWQI